MHGLRADIGQSWSDGLTDVGTASRLDLKALLDRTQGLLENGDDAARPIEILTDGLRVIRDQVPNHYWLSVVIPVARAHDVSELIYQCPLTLHARQRPRGYPGDAQLLDLIYRHPAASSKIHAASGIGKTIFEVTVEVSACESVRDRRRAVARAIDEAAAATPKVQILSLACGNLREAELSEALQSGQIGCLTALDQDSISLCAAGAYAGPKTPIVPRRITVRDILCDRHDLGRFDFIYSAGLYDYLTASAAARLTRKLFDLLNPGGTLLLANFLKGIWEAPYMEAFMDWHLTYRSQAEIHEFASEISPREIDSCTYWTDSGQCIGYLEMRRE